MGLRQPEKPLPINLHCDEFNELMGRSFVAGQQRRRRGHRSPPTRTLSDIQARIGGARRQARSGGSFSNPDYAAGCASRRNWSWRQATATESKCAAREVSSGVTDAHQQLYQQHPRAGDRSNAANRYRRADPASQRPDLCPA